MAKPATAQPINDKSGDQMHRIRRSELLLTELYGLTPRPQYRVRKVRGLRTMLVVSLMTIAVAISVVYYKINIFIMHMEDTRAKEANLEAAIQRRVNLFTNVVKLTLNHAALEHAVFSHTAEMRTEIIKKSKLPDALAEAIGKELSRAAPTGPGQVGGAAGRMDWEQIVKSLAGGDAESSVGRLLAMVEQYPNIKSSETYLRAIGALIEMEDRVAERRAELNESYRLYNTEVTSFPWQYMASATGFAWKDYSHAGNGTTAAKEITPELFQQLVPLTRVIGAPK
ncbi:MAG: LemA family protein [Rhodospirillaceae bacterium]